MSTETNDPELDKLISELEKEGEESKPIIDKQIKKAKQENNDFDVGDKEPEENVDEHTEDYWQ